MADVYLIVRSNIVDSWNPSSRIVQSGARNHFVLQLSANEKLAITSRDQLSTNQEAVGVQARRTRQLFSGVQWTAGQDVVLKSYDRQPSPAFTDNCTSG